MEKLGEAPREESFCLPPGSAGIPRQMPAASPSTSGPSARAAWSRARAARMRPELSPRSSPSSRARQGAAPGR
eukprot:9142244-Pyramimonas_sp.AAC.1